MSSNTIESPPKPLPNSFARHRTRVYPYYKEKSGRDVKQMIDEMLIDQKSRILNCDEHGLSLETLEKYVTQSYWWLIDHIKGDDNAKVYNFWRQNVDVKKVKENRAKGVKPHVEVVWTRRLTKALGIVIPSGEILTIKPREFSDTNEVEKYRETGLDKSGEWREEFERWLLDDSGDRLLEMRNIHFTEEDIEWVKDTAGAVGGVKVEVMNEFNLKVSKI